MILWLLSIFGALGGFILTYQWGGRTLRCIKSVWKTRWSQKPFFYRKLEITAIIANKGTIWQTRRRAHIVAVEDGITEIEVGVTAPNETKHEVSVSPQDLRLVPYKRPRSRFDNYKIQLPLSLRAGHEIAYDFSYNFTKIAPTDDYLAWTSAMRTDLLILRVIFDMLPASRVTLQVVDASESILKEEHVTIDPVTYEARYETTSPRRNLTYQLVWSN